MVISSDCPVLIPLTTDHPPTPMKFLGQILTTLLEAASLRLVAREEPRNGHPLLIDHRITIPNVKASRDERVRLISAFQNEKIQTSNLNHDLPLKRRSSSPTTPGYLMSSVSLSQDKTSVYEQRRSQFFRVVDLAVD